MQSKQELGTLYYRIAEGTPGQVLDMFGSTVEFVSWPSDPHGDFCVMRGVVPPGVTVPLHSHDDAEDFLILAGTLGTPEQMPRPESRHPSSQARDNLHLHRRSLLRSTRGRDGGSPRMRSSC
jgi:anti-sigma factor ChrR (cupin superfamily)